MALFWILCLWLDLASCPSQKHCPKLKTPKALIMQNFCLPPVSCSHVYLSQNVFFQQHDLVNPWSTSNPLQVTGHLHRGLSWARLLIVQLCSWKFLTEYTILYLLLNIIHSLAYPFSNFANIILNLKPVFHFTVSFSSKVFVNLINTLLQLHSFNGNIQQMKLSVDLLQNPTWSGFCLASKNCCLTIRYCHAAAFVPPF